MKTGQTVKGSLMQLVEVFIMSFLGLISGGCIGGLCVRLLVSEKVLQPAHKWGSFAKFAPHCTPS